MATGTAGRSRLPTVTPTALGPPMGQYASLGLRFTLCADDAEVAARIADLYAVCRTTDRREPDLELAVHVDGARATYELRANGEQCCVTTDRDELLAWVVVARQRRGRPSR